MKEKSFTQRNEPLSIDERQRLGKRGSLIGIGSNVLLFVVKLVIGMAAGSVAVMSDAFNNLTDSLSGIISLIGIYMSEKPADAEHPFGHGRVEYITGFIMSVLIFITAFEFMHASILKLIHPSTIRYDGIMMLVLAGTIVIKLILSWFYQRISELTGNLTMKASAKDSLSDALVTGVTILSMFLSVADVKVSYDGIAGCIVSCFIFYSGITAFREIINRLLGSPADETMIKHIKEMLLSDPSIIGVHDMILHDYGAGVTIGSAHVEINGDLPFIEAHAIADRAERRILEEMHVKLTLHMDPTAGNNTGSEKYSEEVKKILGQIVPAADIHDFQLQEKEDVIELHFDLQIPYTCKLSDEEVKTQIDQELQRKYSNVRTVIVFDHGFLSETDI